jgi:ABC-2 type transport system ATP-binding protein
MMALFAEIGYTVPEDAITPPAYGLLAAFSAGIAEEVLMRLFGMAFLAWLGGFLFHDASGRPKNTVMWAAIVIFAFAFGAGHLPAAASLGWPLNTLIITRTIVLNSLGGLILGWLFWTFGLETAMLAHFLADVILYTLLPIIALQEGETTRLLTLSGMVIIVVLSFVWACHHLIVENRKNKMKKDIEPESEVIFPVPINKKSPIKHAICIQNLTKDFDGVRALNNLSLEVSPGTIFGFLGPNGAGKTTTIRLLLGLLEPTSGYAQVLGFDTQTQANLIRTPTGALLEHTGIYEQLSAEDNLEFYGRAYLIPDVERKERIQELLTRMGLWERRKDRAGTWSRGMKQKLAIARTLLHRPSLILLDEPTAGLDVQSAVTIREDLEMLASEENVTIFLTTHNLADAEKLCHQVAVIRQGSLIALGSPAELKSRSANPSIEITGRGFSEYALQLLRTHPQVGTITAQNSHILINLITETDVAALVNILVGAGVQIEEVRRSHASLEEVFLTLTGGHNA